MTGGESITRVATRRNATEQYQHTRPPEDTFTTEIDTW